MSHADFARVKFECEEEPHDEISTGEDGVSSEIDSPTSTLNGSSISFVAVHKRRKQNSSPLQGGLYSFTMGELQGCLRLQGGASKKEGHRKASTFTIDFPTRTARLRQYTSKEPRMFPCTLCPAKFVHSVDLKRHAAIHNVEYFPCVICAETFGDLPALQRHTLTHTQEKPFVCASCPTRFSSASALRAHALTHTDEKPFSCDVCSSRFRHKSTVRRHMQIHGVDHPFSCPLCSEKFKVSSYLKRHIRMHARPHADSL